VKFIDWLTYRHKEWLESTMSMLAPSTGNGGGLDDNDDGGGDGGEEEWDWDRLERRRWNILKWCGETESMKEISRLFGDFIEKQKSTKVTYAVLNSNYPPPKHVLQLRYLFDVDMSPMADKTRKVLERSDLHKALLIDQDELYRTLENDEVREYMNHILCLHLSSDRSPAAGSPFTQSHFGHKKNSALSNYFSFNVWNRLKSSWESKVLPELSAIAVQAASRGRIEKPRSWTDVGKPEIVANPSDVKMPTSVTVYDQERGMVLSSVVAMIPFDWRLSNV
jgi:hypothetical protein